MGILQNIFSTGIWVQLHEVIHPELQALSKNLNATILDSRATNTVTKYIGGFKRFVKWTMKYPEITSVLPCSDIYVSLYLQHLVESVNHFSSVEAAFYSINWAHNTAGVCNPCNSELVKNVVEASKRILTRPIVKKLPVDSLIMTDLFKKYIDSSSLKDIRLLAMCALMYTGFLRYDELCNIKAKHITFYDTHVDIFIHKSKTDCYRNGKSVVISKLDSLFCPVDVLKRYLNMAKVQLNSNMYIFRSVTFLKKSNSFILRRNNDKLSYTRARELIKKSLSELGLDVKNFGLHSFRSGGASAAAKHVSDRLFKAHGRWRSESAKDGYVQEDLDKRLSVSKNLGL